jgi:hypothetical protein
VGIPCCIATQKYGIAAFRELTGNTRERDDFVQLVIPLYFFV